MISFYPGPSRVHDEVPRYVKEAHREGILSMNHRSAGFMEISEHCIDLLKSRLNIPDYYAVYYTSSATECWEIVAQSLVTEVSHHVFNGAFGEKWHDYTRRLVPTAQAHPFGVDELPDFSTLRFDDNEGVICITQNETSNGTQVPDQLIRTIRKKNPQHIIAVDATSSMAGIALDFNAADVWFASVQKCFGLPAGLALMVCSPRAIMRAEKIAERNHYNSLLFMDDMMKKWQTPYTPNVLNIYLLMRVMENSKPIAAVHAKTKRRYQRWIAFLNECKTVRHLVNNRDAHSLTVIPLTGDEHQISHIKSEAIKTGLLLGEGYGKLRPSTFRIANFPAIRNVEIRTLQKFLRSAGA